MNKEELYQQIQTFNNQLTNPSDTGSKTYEKAYLYADDKNAEDKASFITFLIEQGYMDNNYNAILDLAFGSGNLTSHIIFDNDIKYDNIFLNDLNTEHTNQSIVDYIDNVDVWYEDMLDVESFKEDEIDLVIVNPQIGGNYIDGDILRQKEENESQQDVLDKLGVTLQYFIENDATVLFYGKIKDLQSILPDSHYIQYNSKLIDIFVMSNTMEESLCFEKEGNDFVKCSNDQKEDDKVDSFDDITLDVDFLNENQEIKEENNTMPQEEKKQKFSTVALASLDFTYKNILFKGVPGTGKSRAIDNIIVNELKIDDKDKQTNTLRINIHSASSNADLMQGIGISSSGGRIEYREKQGLIYDLIKRATYHPNKPFVLILEEIQENSLNELIGDLIYLIEEDKRAKLENLADDKEYAYQELIHRVIDQEKSIEYVEIPFLVSSSTEYRKMILPDNLYIFCTSNYRDDKKIIEDNLLRRFEVIEIYPKVDVVNTYAKEFFKSLNDEIRQVFSDEIHPDRYMIGHAIWKDVDNTDKFYRAFLKAITEFKDIKEIEFDIFKEVLIKVKLPEDIDENIVKQKNYFELINMLQTKIGYGFTD